MFFYIASLAATGILLFFVGNSLSNVLETLCLEFNLPEWLIGIALGVTTSIPEMITFFESQKHYKKKDGTPFTSQVIGRDDCTYWDEKAEK